ncbi:MAG: glycosyltransferase [Verrucomicrobiota bacterium]
MGAYGMVVPAFTGHLNPMTALGRALQQRGHRVVMISPLDAETKIRHAGLEFKALGQLEFPRGRWEEMTARMGALSGWKASLFCGRWLALSARGILRDLPPILAQESFDGIIMDQISLGTDAVCAVAGVPLAVGCAALALHFETSVPPATVGWRYHPGLWCRARNLFGHLRINYTGIPVIWEVLPFRKRYRLPRLRWDQVEQMPPSLVQLAQQPACFDYPRRHLPDHFHYTGPWQEASRESQITFPWHLLDGRPLIYASIGTLQNGLDWVYCAMAEACQNLDAQVVIALGCKGKAPPAGLRGKPIVVDYAPQLQLLERATLVITHGGLNTVLETLKAGLPLVAIPIANDQPGVGARVEYLGAGKTLPLRHLNADALRAAVRQVLSSSSFRERARYCSGQIRSAGDQRRAAELIEEAFSTRRRVLRQGTAANGGRNMPGGKNLESTELAARKSGAIGGPAIET